ncbi:uncharacterized protein LOC125856302 [Solanum stenotomum]|uniref:uncharacterized protein LOC125856302 n=1 Tax=Solanum stenotomum TaxID=172797 RepID=UPI0020D0B40B|nr:uncharacterized protein LOC125856302 [Solanum stenotomum]
MTVQANREVIAPVNLILGTTSTRIREFRRMYPLEFHGSKVDEGPQEFIDEVYKIVGIMGLSMVEKAELTAYQLKGVAQTWASSVPIKVFRSRFSNIPTPNFSKDRVSNHMPQGGGGNESSILVCKRSGKSHSKKCLAGINGCFGCGKSSHKVKNCSLQASKGKNGRKAQPSDFDWF